MHPTMCIDSSTMLKRQKCFAQCNCQWTVLTVVDLDFKVLRLCMTDWGNNRCGATSKHLSHVAGGDVIASLLDREFAFFRFITKVLRDLQQAAARDAG